MTKENPDDRIAKVELKLFNSLLDAYQKSMLVCHGSPDQFQYRQNLLLQELTKYVIFLMIQGRDEKPKTTKRKKRK